MLCMALRILIGLLKVLTNLIQFQCFLCASLFWCFGGPSQIFEAASLKQKMVIINIQPSVAPILFAINSSRNFQPALAAITFSHHQSIQDVSYIMKEMGIYLTPYDRVVQVEV